MFRIVTIVFLIFSSVSLNAQLWVEDFGNDATCGIADAAGYTTANGVWTTQSTGTNGIASHNWYVGAQESEMAVGDCGSGCLEDSELSDNTLYVSDLAFDASYGAVFQNGPDRETNLRVVSPVVNFEDVSDNMVVTLRYIYGGHPTSTCVFEYFDGTSWSDIWVVEPTTGSCNGAGLWSEIWVDLPPEASGNPNVQFGFRWENTGPDMMLSPELSFALGKIECHCGAIIDAGIEEGELLNPNVQPNPSLVTFLDDFDCTFYHIETFHLSPWAAELFGQSTIEVECTAGCGGSCSTGSVQLEWEPPGCPVPPLTFQIGSNNSYFPPDCIYEMFFSFPNGSEVCPGECLDFSIPVAGSSFGIEVTGSATIQNLQHLDGDAVGQVCFSEPGNYTLSSSSTDPFNPCFGSWGIANISVPSPDIVPEITASQTQICAGACVEIYMEEIPGADVEWTFEGGTPATSDQQQPGQVCYETPGNYEVSVTITGEAGCGYGTLSEAIQVENCDEIPTAAFSVSDTLICEGECIDFTDLSTGVEIDTWDWQFQGAETSSSTEQHPSTICYENAGSYTVILEVSNAAGSDDTTMTGVVKVESCPTIISDIEISNANYGSFDPLTDTTWKDLEYSEYHICQVRPLDLTAMASNVGTVDQTNVYLEVEIDNQWGFEESVMSGPIDIAVGDSAKLTIPEYLPPNDPGAYTLTYTLHADQNDSLPDNNLAYRDFRIHETSEYVNNEFCCVHTLARDDGQLIAASQNGGEYYSVLMGFHFTAPAEVCCVGAAFSDSSSVGAHYMFELWSPTGGNLSPTWGTLGWISESILGQIGAGDFYNSDLENFTWLPMDLPVTVPPNTDVLVRMINFIGNDSISFARVGISNFDAPDSSSYIYFDDQDTSYWSMSNATYMIRIGLSNEFCNTAMAEVADQVTGLSCIPNPSPGAVVVQFNLLEKSEVQLFLFDGMGRVIYEERKGTLGTGNYRFEYDWSHLPAGMYNLTIASDGKAVSQKIVLE